MTLLHPEGIHLLVINLDRSKDRWSHMQSMLTTDSCWNIERISAVDGAHLSESIVNQFYDPVLNKKHYFVPLKTAEIACFLSHRMAWQRIVDSEWPYACVVEDDIEFVQPPSTWIGTCEAMLLTAKPVAIRVYTARSIRGKLINRINNLYDLIEPKLTPLGMQALLINKAAAKIWLDQTQTIYEPVDVAIQRHWDMGFKQWAMQPSMAQEVSHELGGTTLHSQQRLPLHLRIKREFARPCFRLSRWIRSHLT